MLSLYSFPVIVSSSVFRYIEKTTLKINEYQQLHSELIPSECRDLRLESGRYPGSYCHNEYI